MTGFTPSFRIPDTVIQQRFSIKRNPKNCVNNFLLAYRIYANLQNSSRTLLTIPHGLYCPAGTMTNKSYDFKAYERK